MVFTTEALLEVAIEGWPEWDLNPRPPNSVQTLSHTQCQLCAATAISSLCSVFTFSFRPLLSSVTIFALSGIWHRQSHECSGMN